MIETLDLSVGQIVKKLKKLKLFDNTLLIFVQIMEENKSTPYKNHLKKVKDGFMRVVLEYHL